MKSPLNRGGLRYYLVAVALLCGALLFRTTSLPSILAGLPFLILGVSLHVWAKGCLRQNRAVAMIGPYRFVRHPFYLANALVDASLVVMAGWWPLALALPPWWLAIYLPVIRGEEGFLTEKFPGDYADYRRRVPCLVPWRRPLSRTDDGFRWRNPNIAGGEELPRAARLLAYPLLFYLVQGLRAGGLPWLGNGWNLTALAGLIMLYALAWELHRHQRQRGWILPAAMRGLGLRVATCAAVMAAACCIPGPRTTLRFAGARRSSTRPAALKEAAIEPASRLDLAPIGGVILMLLSLPVFSRRPDRVALAEAIGLMAAIAAAELFWLAPAVIVTYAAWMLDRQLALTKSSEGAPGAVLAPPVWPWLYPVVAVVAAAVIVRHGL